MIIVKIQACFRMYMAKKRVSAIRGEYYSPGMGGMHDHGEDFDNINVQVSDFGHPNQNTRNDYEISLSFLSEVIL